MASHESSLELFYRTQPPQQISKIKLDAVLEYLTFSSAPIYLTILKTGAAPIRLDQPGSSLDVTEDAWVIELPEATNLIEPNQLIDGSFGYKRKRAQFQAEVIQVDGKNIHLKKPESLMLTNLRRNPRLQVDPTLHRSGLKVVVHSDTSVGKVKIDHAQVYEMSQLGISLFLDRSQGLLLPGDKVEALEIFENGQLVMKTSGVVSRVDMKRRSPTLPNSYEVVLLYRSFSEKLHLGEVARSAKRIPILDTKPCFFSAEHPLFPGRKLEGQVFEISSSGLSCILNKTAFPIIPGLMLRNCQLQLPHKPQRQFQFEVVHVDFHSDGNENQFRIGGEFVKASVELIKDISSYAQETEGGLIKDVAEEDFDLLWEFMFETNFIYQSKRRQLQNQSKEILQTYHRLVSTDNPIIKKLVFKEGSEIKGHVSAVRFHDHAWIIQHLNALKTSGTSAAQAVVQSIVNFFIDAKANMKTETFYVMSYYRNDNVYPAILFGESCRRINNPSKSVVHDFMFGTFQRAELGQPSQNLIDRIEIDTTKNVLGLSDYLISKNMISYMRAIGLGAATSVDLKIKDVYQSLELYRERHVLSLSHEYSTVYALVEMASPGLNLSELTNAITLFSDNRAGIDLSEIYAALLAKCHDLYFAPRDMTPVVLQETHEQRSPQINWAKVYTCWVTSAAAVRDFEITSRSVIADFKKLLSEMKKKDDEDDRGRQRA